MWRTIRLGIPEPHQEEFIFSDAFHRAIVGGVGSGKTWSGIVLAMKAAIDMPGVPGALVNATYTLLEDTTLQEWFDVIPPEAYRWRAGRKIIELYNGSKIYCRSADQPLKRIAGLNLGWVVYDESGLARDDAAARMLLQRIRRGDPSKRFFAMVTSPRQHRWLKNWCDRDGMHLIGATTYDNPHTGDDYKEKMAQEFPPGTKLHDQEMGGQFISLTGLVYGEWFTRTIHVIGDFYDQRKPFDLGWDPGSRASGVIAFQDRPQYRLAVRQWTHNGEFTEDTARAIKRDMGRTPRNIYIDTPSKLNTRTGITDVQALREVFPTATIRVLGGRRRESEYRHRAVSSALNRRKLFFSESLLPSARTSADERGIVTALESLEWSDAAERLERVDEKSPMKHVVDALEFYAASRLPPQYYDPAERRVYRMRHEK